jgi:hypothetical protein
VNHHEDSGVGNTDSALDEAVRSILTSWPLDVQQALPSFAPPGVLSNWSTLC